jgi:hypothetical protein
MQDSLDSLPPRARARLDELLARLPADLLLHSLCQTATGWTVTLHDRADRFGAEIALLDEPASGENGSSTLPASGRVPAA